MDPRNAPFWKENQPIVSKAPNDAYRKALFWKRSTCCNAHITPDDVTKRYICKKCSKPCDVK